MRIAFLALSALVVVGLVAVSTVQADNHAAVIKNTGECTMVGASADGTLMYAGGGLQTTRVENGNKVMLKCTGTDVPNLSGKAQSFSGFPCGVQAPDGRMLAADESRANVSASGAGSLTCTVAK